MRIGVLGNRVCLDGERACDVDESGKKGVSLFLVGRDGFFLFPVEMDLRY